MTLSHQTLRALCDAATPGPWRCAHDDEGSTVFGRHGGQLARLAYNRNPWDHDDAELIAAARTAIPTLLDEFDRLKAERDDKLRALRKSDDDIASMAARCSELIAERDTALARLAEVERAYETTQIAAAASENSLRAQLAAAQAELSEAVSFRDRYFQNWKDASARADLLGAIESRIANWDWAGLLRDAKRVEFDSCADALRDVVAIEESISAYRKGTP